MHWLVYLLISILTAALGLVCGGTLGSWCVRWYRISSFEGGSGYFVIGIALAGGVVGLILGLVASIWCGPREGIDYLKTFGLAAAGVLALAGLITGVCWWRADIPPTLGGHELMVEVEIRLPAGAERPAPAKATVELHSVVGNTARASEEGELDLQSARLEDRRWIVPGTVHLFTQRGRRSLVFRIRDETVAGFLLPLSARPGAKYLEWSAWLPQPRAPHPAWPEDRPSYRFRVRPIIPEPQAPVPTPEEAAAARHAGELARLEALPADASLADWLGVSRTLQDADARQVAIGRILARPDVDTELVRLMCAGDTDTATQAARLVRSMPAPSDEIVAGVGAAGRDLVERLRAGVAIQPADDESYLWAADISLRFSAWMDAMRHLREVRGAAEIDALAQILDLARTRPDSLALRADVVRVASYYLHEWAGVAPLPTDPKPR